MIILFALARDDDNLVIAAVHFVKDRQVAKELAIQHGYKHFAMYATPVGLVENWIINTDDGTIQFISACDLDQRTFAKSIIKSGA